MTQPQISTTEISAQVVISGDGDNSVAEVIVPGPQGPAGASAPRALTVLDPLANDSFTLFYTKVSTTIASVRALVQGTNPSVTFILKADPDRSAAGTEISINKTVTSSTTGEEATIINQPIPQNHYVWLEITATSGTVTEFNAGIEV
jgi:hypothetical protein